ncbi:oogenesis-related [Pseudochaenichthys georgianus]|uniref:oogenesis-related n=1 Tax=Pseudochaenichthys georgianus TaxID=52239 RepID=UPI00146B6A41|nr:oogenesis-related [Pseudochaenichthys georgianus]
MTCEIRTETVELEQVENSLTEEDSVVRSGGVFRSVLRGLLWPFGIVVYTYRGFWWVLGYRQPQEKAVLSPSVLSPGRQSLSGRKRLHRVTRLLLSVLPRWVQSKLGYPVSSSIGLSLSPEIRVSPTKPCGKGSKRKQAELDEDEEEEESQTWVEALNQELADDEDLEVDPDYEPSSIDTESEEYCSHNDTDMSESDIEMQGKAVLIEDVNTGVELSTPDEVSYPAV